MKPPCKKRTFQRAVSLIKSPGKRTVLMLGKLNSCLIIGHWQVLTSLNNSLLKTKRPVFYRLMLSKVKHRLSATTLLRRLYSDSRLQGWCYVKNVPRHQHDMNRRIKQGCKSEQLFRPSWGLSSALCNEDMERQPSNAHQFGKLQTNPFTTSSFVLWTDLQSTVFIHFFLADLL